MKLIEGNATIGQVKDRMRKIGVLGVSSIGTSTTDEIMDDLDAIEDMYREGEGSLRDFEQRQKAQ